MPKFFTLVMLLLATACTPLRPASQPSAYPNPQATTALPTLTVSPAVSTVTPTAPNPNATPTQTQIAIGYSPLLAEIMRTPRPTQAYRAMQRLIEIGPKQVGMAVAILVGNLMDEDPVVRAQTLLVLASVGQDASCSVGHIGPMLWDSDPTVRSASALALERITGETLLSSQHEIDITPAIQLSDLQPDLPEGTVVSAARTWWTETGSAVNSHLYSGICGP